MTAVYLPTNQAWAVVFGGRPVTVWPAGRTLWNDRETLVLDLRDAGLRLTEADAVAVL